MTKEAVLGGGIKGSVYLIRCCRGRVAWYELGLRATAGISG
jgi:hypothetical protein